MKYLSKHKKQLVNKLYFPGSAVNIDEGPSGFRFKTELLTVGFHSESKCSGGRTRTGDLAINSRVLYQLSYSGIKVILYFMAPPVSIMNFPQL